MVGRISVFSCLEFRFTSHGALGTVVLIFSTCIIELESLPLLKVLGTQITVAAWLTSVARTAVGAAWLPTSLFALQLILKGGRTCDYVFDVRRSTRIRNCISITTKRETGYLREKPMQIIVSISFYFYFKILNSFYEQYKWCIAKQFINVNALCMGITAYKIMKSIYITDFFCPYIKSTRIFLWAFGLKLPFTSYF